MSLVALSAHIPETWGKWFFLLMAVHAFYSIFSERQRNLMYGEFYKFRFMKRDGSPASIRTSLLAFTLWSLASLRYFHPKLWEWEYSGVLLLGGIVTVMISSYLDARSFRNRS